MNFLIGTAGHDDLAVRAESHGMDPAIVVQSEELFPRGRVPEPGRSVKAARVIQMHFPGRKALRRYW